MSGNLHNSFFRKAAGFATALALASPVFAEKPLHQRIDDLVKARAGEAPFAESAKDASFLRRVTLDLSGNIPTADKVPAFLKDKSPNKRT